MDPKQERRDFHTPEWSDLIPWLIGLVVIFAIIIAFFAINDHGQTGSAPRLPLSSVGSVAG